MKHRNGWRPLVYLAPGVLAQARRIMGGAPVPENVIRDAIVAGHVECGRRGRVWDAKGGWIALVERVPGRFRKRPHAWLVVSITRPRSKR